MKDFRAIIEEHYPILYKIGRSYARNNADFDDLYQEMLIHIYDSLKNFRSEARISTWIYRVALNTALTYQRNGNKRSREVEVDEMKMFETENPEPGEKETREKNIELLYKSIHQLPKEERAIILLHLEGKNYDEIAEIIGISKTNTGVKIMRIKKRLQELLVKNGYERY